MKKVGWFKRNIRLKSFQNKNISALEYLIKSGFKLPEIRKGLMVLNRVRMSDLAVRVSVVTASNTIHGRRRNEDVMAGLSEKLGIDADLLFPEGN